MPVCVLMSCTCMYMDMPAGPRGGCQACSPSTLPCSLKTDLSLNWSQACGQPFSILKSSKVSGVHNYAFLKNVGTGI